MVGMGNQTRTRGRWGVEVEEGRTKMEPVRCDKEAVASQIYGAVECLPICYKN